MTSRPVAEGLWVERDGLAYLVGGSCAHCGTTTFPQQESCPRCTRSEMGPRELPRTGSLWSWTVQGFEPKPPYQGDWTPYGVGYVDLGDVIVEARLTESDPSRLRIGSDLTLVLVPLRERVQTFAFGSAS